MIFIETDRFNSNKINFGNLYINIGNQNIEFFWFGYGITLIK